MPLFRRKKNGDRDASDNNNNNIASMSESQPLACDESEGSIPEIDKETQKKAQDIMKDHLDIMRDVVMKIRHQEGYAKAMYANCPRLQHLLDRNPDLRPVFEDPRLVRINFETVYKEAGGILPEDEEEEERKRNNPSLILRIANHPIFKFLKLLIFVKKIIGCIAGGGIALVSSCWACCTDCCTDCCCEDVVEQIGEMDEDNESENEYGIDTDAPLDDNQRALNTAADYMEDPEVQEHMQRLLEDPENLEDAIENDAELRALRDSNPLCAELMQDPETMKILTDPDNLRALGEAPQMIELDFSDPHGFSPEADFVDVEAGEFDGFDASGEDFLEASGSMNGLEAYDADYDENEVYFPMEDDPNDLVMDDGGDGEMDEGFEDEMVEEDEELGAEEIEMTEVAEEPVPQEQVTASGWEDNFDMEQQEIEVELEADADPDAEAANKGKGKGKEARQRKTETQKQGGIAGVVSSLGVAATDVIAASIVGEVFGSDFLPGDLLSGGDMGPDLGAIDQAATQADAVVNDDVADLAEDTAEDIQDEKEAQKETVEEDKRSSRYSIDETGRKNYVGLMGTTAAAAAAAAALAPMIDQDEEDSIDDGLESIGSEESDFRDEEDSQEKASDIEESPAPEKPKSKVGGFFKSLASATVTAAKEHVAGALLGDDFGEMLVEKQEELGESSSEDEKEEEDENKKKKKKRFRLFGRKKDEEEEEEEGFDIDETLRESFQISATAKNDQSFYDANEVKDEYNPNFNASIPDYNDSHKQFNMRDSTVSIPPGHVFEADDDGEERDPNFYSSNPEYSMSIPERNSMNGHLVFDANPGEEEYDPNFSKSNPDYISSEFTFAANEDEEEYDPNFYRKNPEYTSSFRDEDDTLEGSSSRRGYFG